MSARRLSLVGLFVLALALGVLWLNCPDKKIRNVEFKGDSHPSVTSLSALLALPPNKLSGLDIGQVNLLCAEGLPGAEDLNVSNSLTMLDQVATRARSETERHYYRFRKSPGEFENSEGFFRMLMLSVVLAEDFQVHYAPDKISTVAEATGNDGFFSDSQYVFLHGLTGLKRQGTCSSLPVLQVAVGRRLGYPLKLVTTKGHLFVRWEDSLERFNIEAAGQGVNHFPDDYYRHWPMEVSEHEVQAEGYLKSLSPADELAVFLSIRGMCLQAAKRYAEAEKCFEAATQLAPGSHSYRMKAVELERRALDAIPSSRNY